MLWTFWTLTPTENGIPADCSVAGAGWQIKRCCDDTKRHKEAARLVPSPPCFCPFPLRTLLLNCKLQMTSTLLLQQRRKGDRGRGRGG